MDREKAVRCLDLGKRVRHKSWTPGMYVYASNGTVRDRNGSAIDSLSALYMLNESDGFEDLDVHVDFKTAAARARDGKVVTRLGRVIRYTSDGDISVDFGFPSIEDICSTEWTVE